MNRRVIEHYTDQVARVLEQIEQADSGRLNTTEYRQKIQFIENKVKMISKVSWNRADELQRLLTNACLAKEIL